VTRAVSNSPSFEDAAVLKFFETSTTDLLACEIATGVAHHVALSVVAPARIQPMAQDDVAEALCRVAIEPPLNGTIEVAGSARLEAFSDPVFGIIITIVVLEIRGIGCLTDGSPRLRAPTGPAAALGLRLPAR
jgi:hypothetical protein